MDFKNVLLSQRKPCSNEKDAKGVYLCEAGNQARPIHRYKSEWLGGAEEVALKLKVSTVPTVDPSSVPSTHSGLPAVCTSGTRRANSFGLLGHLNSCTYPHIDAHMHIMESNKNKI